MLSAANPQSNVVMSTDYVITFDGTSQFTVIPKSEAQPAINLPAYIAFNEDVNFPNPFPVPLVISNVGTAPLVVTSIVYQFAGYSGNWSRGVIQPGGSQTVTVSYNPNNNPFPGWVNCSGTINSNAIPGSNTFMVYCHNYPQGVMPYPPGP